MAWVCLVVTGFHYSKPGLGKTKLTAAGNQQTTGMYDLVLKINGKCCQFESHEVTYNSGNVHLI